jgi:diguanylate cyclase (GGDEF)-like protein
MNPVAIESKLYVIILYFCIILSAISIAGNFISRFPLAISIKWGALILVALFAYMIEKKGQRVEEARSLFFAFVILMFLPFAFLDSGGSNNNALGYTFLILVAVTYLFKEWTRLALIAALIAVFVLLLLVEYHLPHLVHQQPARAQLIDRMIQVPLQIVAIFLIILQFSRAYDRTNQELAEERAKLQDSMERLILSEQKLQESNLELERLAVTDKLTQLPNRVKIDEMLERELARTGRSGQEFSILILDIDYFKSINDTHGHQAGDVVLKEFAATVKDSLRKTDTVGRWGGEEFLVVVPSVGIEAAAVTAEKLRQIIETNPFTGVPRITCSFGVTSSVPGDTVTAMIKRADQALYRAKNAGRNRVEVEAGP